MSNSIPRAAVRSLFLIVVVASLAGCSDAYFSPSELGTVQSALGRIDLGEKAFVELYEIEPGELAFYEERSVDDFAAPLDKSAWSQLTPSEIHRQLKPGAPVPPALAAADERVRAARGKRAKMPNGPGGPPERLSFVSGTAPPGPPDRDKKKDGAIGRPDGGAPANAEPNTLAHDAETDWWNLFYCSTYQMHDVWCPMNQPGISSGWTWGMFYESSGANMAHGSNAVFFVEWWNGSQSVRVHTRTLGPRSVGQWSWPTEHWFWGGVTGDGPDSRVFYSRRIRTPIPWFTLSGYNPSDAGHAFDNDIDGVTHDDQWWYFTRTDVVGTDEGELSTPLHVSWNLQYVNPGRITINPWYGAGWNHFGDLTIRGNYLYIPMNQVDNPGAGCAVGVITTGQSVVGWSTLPNNSNCSWIAYNPNDDLFYMPDDVFIRKYRILIGWDQSVNIQEVTPTLTPFGIEGSWQGADFSPRGNLYIFNGWNEDKLRIYGVDPYNGQVYGRGYFPVDPTWWEAEGVSGTSTRTIQLACERRSTIIDGPALSSVQKTAPSSSATPAS